MHFILFYETSDDYLTRRTPHRAAHLALAKEAFDRGELLFAGALADPPDMALIVFRTRRAAEEFAAKDPYVANGVMKSWRVREWTTVIGEGIAPPKV